MKLAVVAAVLVASSAALADPQVQVLAGAAIPLDSNGNSSGTLDVVAKGLWRENRTSYGLALHWAPLYEDGQRFRLHAELQSVIADDGALAWMLLIGVGAEFLQSNSSDSVTTRGWDDWEQAPIAEAGVCMAFTGWRFPPLLCLALNIGLTTGNIEASPLVGLRF
jgi:opacity protein-like surface antigen